MEAESVSTFTPALIASTPHNKIVLALVLLSGGYAARRETADTIAADVGPTHELLVNSASVAP